MQKIANKVEYKNYILIFTDFYKKMKLVHQIIEHFDIGPNGHI